MFSTKTSVKILMSTIFGLGLVACAPTTFSTLPVQAVQPPGNGNGTTGDTTNPTSTSGSNPDAPNSNPNPASPTPVPTPVPTPIPAPPNPPAPVIPPPVFPPSAPMPAPPPPMPPAPLPPALPAVPACQSGTCQNTPNGIVCDVAPGGTLTVTAALQYNASTPGFGPTANQPSWNSDWTLPAMGLGTEMNGVALGYFTPNYPFSCVAREGQNGAGLGNDAIDPADCEVNFSSSGGGIKQGTGIYTVTANTNAAPGSNWPVAYNTNPGGGAHVLTPNFTIHICQ